MTTPPPDRDVWAPPAPGAVPPAPPPPPAQPSWPPPAGWSSPYPQPGWAAWPPPPAPPVRRRWLLGLGIAVGVLALLGGCAAAVGVLAPRALRGAFPQLEAGVTADMFLDAVERGDGLGQSGLSCPGTSPQVPGVLRSYEQQDVTVAGSRPHRTAVAREHLVLVDGTAHDVRLLLEEHQGTWLVCGVQPG